MSDAVVNTVKLQVACGLLHTVVVADSGQVWTFGGGRYGQLGNDRQRNEDSPVWIQPKVDNNEIRGERMTDKPVVQVAAGAYHTAALRNDGKLYTWGHDANGRLGHGAADESKNIHTNRLRTNNMPMLVYELSNVFVTQVSCGTDFTMCVDSSGDVFTWGLGNYGNLGHGSTTDCLRPKLVEKMKIEVVTMCAAGAKHSLVLTQRGDIWSFGHGDNGRLGNGASLGSLVPTMLEEGMHSVNTIYIAAGEAHSACIDETGKLYTWGTGSYGRLGLGEESDQSIPVEILQCVSCHAVPFTPVRFPRMAAFTVSVAASTGNWELGMRVT